MKENNVGRHVIRCTRHVRITDIVTQSLASLFETNCTLLAQDVLILRVRLMY